MPGSSATARSLRTNDFVVNHRKVLTADVVEPLLRGRFGRPYLWQETLPRRRGTCSAARICPRGSGGNGAQTAERGGGRRRALGEPPGASLSPRSSAAARRSPAEQLALVAGLAVAEAVEERGRRRR